jgi:hypothetical protein
MSRDISSPVKACALRYLLQLLRCIGKDEGRANEITTGHVNKRERKQRVDKGGQKIGSEDSCNK